MFGDVGAILKVAISDIGHTVQINDAWKQKFFTSSLVRPSKVDELLLPLGVFETVKMTSSKTKIILPLSHPN